MYCPMCCFQRLRNFWGWLVMSIQQMLFAGGKQVINLTISTTQTGVYDIFSQAGSPSGPVEVNLTVNADCQVGIIQGSGWVSGSTCTITNNATIYGTGGGGGDGGQASYYNVNLKFFTDGAGGGFGGDALSLSIPTTVVNNGNIYGGGGGGGGGSASANVQPASWQEATLRAGGGGGGGGQGFNNAGGGVGGITVPYNWEGSDGSSGSSSGGGAGGAGGIAGILQVVGGDGGGGGGWGQDGSSGSSGSGLENTTPGGGGAAGYAIRQNGNALTLSGAGSTLGNVG